MDNLKETIVSSYLSLIFKVGLVLVILATFFLFSNLTTDFYDTPKFLLLVIFTSLLLILLTLKFTVAGKVVFLRTPLDLPLLLLLAVAVVSTFLSPSPWVALLGNQARVHGNLVSLVVYVLFYFVLVNNLKSKKEVNWILYITLIAAQVLSIVTLLTYFGLKILPPPWTHGVNFTPTGSSFATTAVLAMLIPIVTVQILHTTKLPTLLLNSTFLILYGVTIALTGTWATWIAAVFGIVLPLVVIDPISRISHISKIGLNLLGLITPLTIVVLITILSFIPPIGGAKNPLYDQAKNFPREIQLPFITSWKVSVSAFRDSPFWGSGPSTYLFDFTTYKPPQFNSTKVWNLRFDSAFNEYLQVLANLGGIGLLALLSFTVLFVSGASKVILEGIRLKRFGGENQISGEKLALATAGLTFFVILALHASTLVVWVMGLLILASFMVVNLSEGLPKSWQGGDIKTMFLRLAANISAPSTTEETLKIDTLPGVLLTIAISLVLFAFFFGGKIVLADYHHRVALNAVAQNNGVLAYNELVAAEKLNPQNDLYRTDLAQTNFALANAIALAKGPTEASPGGSLTDQDKQNIQLLLQQSINEARTAVTLSPRSAINWEILALLYRQISGVAQNALLFSLDAYGRAIFQDPLNPLLRLNVGGTYYAIQNYDLAIRFFTDSVNLKPDFANGYYNLSVALRDKGDLASAQAAAERVLQLVEADSQDYKVVSDYLSDLKNRIATGSAQASPIQPPAAQTTGALQQKELPKVVDVGNPPEKIATPAAIKKPGSTPEPSPTP